jgi:predicted porin
MYKLNYKKCDHAVKGSFDIYATYFHMPKSVVFDGESPSLADKNTFRVGTDYTFAKNIWLQAYYGWNRNIATDVPGQEMRFKLNFVL